MFNPSKISPVVGSRLELITNIFSVFKLWFFYQLTFFFTVNFGLSRVFSILEIYYSTRMIILFDILDANYSHICKRYLWKCTETPSNLDVVECFKFHDEHIRGNKGVYKFFLKRNRTFFVFFSSTVTSQITKLATVWRDNNPWNWSFHLTPFRRISCVDKHMLKQKDLSNLKKFEGWGEWTFMAE